MRPWLGLWWRRLRRGLGWVLVSAVPWLVREWLTDWGIGASRDWVLERAPGAIGALALALVTAPELALLAFPVVVLVVLLVLTWLETRRVAPPVVQTAVAPGIETR